MSADHQVTKELKPKQTTIVKKKKVNKTDLKERVRKALVLPEISKVPSSEHQFSTATGISKAEQFETWLNHFIPAIQERPDLHPILRNVEKYSIKMRKYALRYSIGVCELAKQVDDHIPDSDDEYEQSDDEFSSSSSEESGEDSEADQEAEEEEEAERNGIQINKLDDEEDEIADMSSGTDDDEDDEEGKKKKKKKTKDSDSGSQAQ